MCPSIGKATDPRAMLSTTLDTLDFQLYQIAALSIIWGSRPGVAPVNLPLNVDLDYAVPALGGGSATRTFTLYGCIPAQTSAAAGAYASSSLGVVAGEAYASCLALLDPVGVRAEKAIALQCDEGQLLLVVWCLRSPQLMDYSYSVLLDPVYRAAQPDLDEKTYVLGHILPSSLHFGTVRPNGAAIHSATFPNARQARDTPSLRTRARCRRAATTDTSAVATAIAVLSPWRARARHAEAAWCRSSMLRRA
jgi:hypothetical protein